MAIVDSGGRGEDSFQFPLNALVFLSQYGFIMDSGGSQRRVIDSSATSYGVALTSPSRPFPHVEDLECVSLHIMDSRYSLSSFVQGLGHRNKCQDIVIVQGADLLVVRIQCTQSYVGNVDSGLS